MVFDRSAYLQLGTQLLCIGIREIGASSITGLFSANIVSLPDTIQADASVRCEGATIWIGDQARLSFANASTFRSSFLYAHEQIEDGKNLAQLHSAQHHLIRSLKVPGEGLAPVLHRVADRNWSKKEVDAMLIVRCLPVIAYLFQRIAQACTFNDEHDCAIHFRTDSIKPLLGAGPGLTPSGDDFICGIFAALFVYRKEHIAQALWRSIEFELASATTLVSSELLRHSARGELSEPMEKMIKAYYETPVPQVSLVQSLADSVGACSGWDWLTGFVVCQQALTRPENR